MTRAGDDEGVPPTAAAAVRTIAERVTAAGAALRALSDDRIVTAIITAGARLADAGDPLGVEALAILPATTELSPEMVRWALRTSCGPDATRALTALTARWRLHDPHLVVQPMRLAVAVLAGNVFTAPFRVLASALVARVPVVAKAPSRDDLFSRLFAHALGEVDPIVGAAVGVVTFEGGATEPEDVLFAAADVVLAYGSDHTLAEIRRRLPSHVQLAPHGHGLGAAYVTASALETPVRAHEAARGLALDVAAYDQRGCLSPQVVLVTRFGRTTPRELASLLAQELAVLAAELPRGPLPVEVGARQLQWRGVAAARGDLFEGDGYAVSYEGDGALRLGPGHRNVLVLAAGDARDAVLRLLPLGSHLKCLGVAATDDERASFARALSAPLAPRVCAVGTMQTPPLDAPWDACDPLDGLARLVALE